MKKIFKNLLLLSLVSFLFLSPVFVLAQKAGNPSPNQIIIKNPFKQDTIEGLIKVVVNEIILPIGAVLAVLYIIYAGFLYVTSRGDPSQVKKAHEAFLNAVIGTAILLGAWVISEAIYATIKQLKV